MKQTLLQGTFEILCYPRFSLALARVIFSVCAYRRWYPALVGADSTIFHLQIPNPGFVRSDRPYPLGPGRDSRSKWGRASHQPTKLRGRFLSAGSRNRLQKTVWSTADTGLSRSRFRGDVARPQGG